MAVSTIRFLGAAQDVSDIWTYTIGGTPAATNTAWLELNNKRLTLTLGTDVTTTDVAQELAAMINATVNNATTKVGAYSDETWNVAGQTVPEWTEVSATSSGAVLTLTGAAGVPIQGHVTVGVTGGGVTISSASSVQTATGKHFWDNAANWEGGVVPAKDSAGNLLGDTALFDSGGVDVKYALNNTEENISIIRTLGYTGDIGLPPVNLLGYKEYRQQKLDAPIYDSVDSVQTILIGETGSAVLAKGITRIDLGADTSNLNYPTVTVLDSAASSPTDGESVQISGGTKTRLTVRKGSVSLGMDRTANTSYLYSTLYIGSMDEDCTVRLGPNSSVPSALSGEQYGGKLYLNGTITGLTMLVKSGTCYQLSGALVAATVYSKAKLALQGGSCAGAITMKSGSTLSVESAGTYSGATLSQAVGSTLSDPFGLLSLSGGAATVPV